MKINLKKRYLFNLFVGIFWILIGIVGFIDDTSTRWTDYAFIVVGIVYVLHYFYDRKHQYVRIENEEIIPNRLYGLRSRIKINEIISVTKKWGEYKIETSEKSLILNSQMIKENDLEKLKEFFISLNLPEEKLEL